MNDLLTKNCIVCFKPATSWTGHVHKDINELFIDDAITSGWCDEHNKHTQNNGIEGCMGCDGKWIEEMGIMNGLKG